MENPNKTRYNPAAFADFFATIEGTRGTNERRAFSRPFIQSGVKSRRYS